MGAARGGGGGGNGEIPSVGDRGARGGVKPRVVYLTLGGGGGGGRGNEATTKFPDGGALSMAGMSPSVNSCGRPAPLPDSGAGSTGRFGGGGGGGGGGGAELMVSMQH